VVVEVVVAAAAAAVAVVVVVVVVVKLSYPFNRPWRPIGLLRVKGPIVSRQSAHRWRYGCQP
jgi:hypothetical protein